MLEIDSNHILGAIVGFLGGYLAGVFTSKLLKLVIGLIIAAGIIGYIYFKYFRQEIPDFGL